MSATTKRKPTGRLFMFAAAMLVLLLASACSRQDGVELVREPVSQELSGATRADVEIALGVGQLHIGAQEQPDGLIAGEIAYPERNKVTRNFAVQGDTASFSLRQVGDDDTTTFRFNEQAPVWDLRLSPATPLRLLIETGVGENVIDLAELAMTEVTLRTGVGATTLTLPRSGQVQAMVEGGVGTTTIRIPAGVGVRLKVEAGVGGTDVPTTYRQENDIFLSPGYDTAAAQVQLQASTGIGKVTIEQLDN